MIPAYQLSFGSASLPHGCFFKINQPRFYAVFPMPPVEDIPMPGICSLSYPRFRILNSFSASLF